MQVEQHSEDYAGLAARLKFYGDNELAQRYGAEFILSGPSETGKTVAMLTRLHRLACTVRNGQFAIIRKTYASMPGSVIETFEKKVLGPNALAPGLIDKYGGDKPEWYDYALTGARIWVGGIDNPGRSLSSERDAVYVNQTEELEAGDWETLVTRSTGRAGNWRNERNEPIGLLFGDANPGPPNHWILSRERVGHLKLFKSMHRNNPALYDQLTGQLTPQGVTTMAALDSLTGFRRSRLRDGLWVQAEGIVFDRWRNPGNVTLDAEYNPALDVLWFIDDGYSAGGAADTAGLDPVSHEYIPAAHPRVILFAQERNDGTLVVFDESYACLRLSDEHFATCLGEDDSDESRRFAKYTKPIEAIHGPGAAEIRGRLMAIDVAPHSAKCDVGESIKELNTSLKADKNNMMGVIVHPRCVHLCAEMVTMAWDPKKVDEPVKASDHGPDALRYGNWVKRFRRL